MKSVNLFPTTIIKTFTLLLLCIMCACKSNGQTSPKTYGKIDVEITKEKKPKRIYSKVKIISPFFGGDSSWIRTLENTLNHSLLDLKKIKKGKYIVTAVFIASSDSTLSDIQCTTCPGFGITEKVISALKKNSKWLPSSQGIPVRPYRTSSSTPQINNQ